MKNFKRKTICIVIGTRPELIKQISVYNECIKKIGKQNVLLINSGQHREFLDLYIKEKRIKFDISLKNMQSTISLKKNIQKSISVFYKLIKKLRPKIVLVQGDTTTAAGCAYAASLSSSLVAHNEAGLRTFDNKNPYPEELNRKLISSVCDIHFAPTKLNEMLDQIESHDLVVASRYLQGVTVVNWPIQRLLLSWLGNHYARLITGVPVTDLTGGFRCIRRTLLEKSRFERTKSNGYAFQIELNCRLNKHRPRIKELTFLFFDRTRGDSKLSFATVIEAIWIVWWLRILDITNRL